MSLVGPRPCLAYEIEQFTPHHFERFLVPAGVTGLWQVTARAHSTFGEALDMDVAYARGWSLGLDLWLMLRTPFAVLRRGATSVSAPRPRQAVVGLGYWGPNLVRNLNELPEAELACDLRPQAGRARHDVAPLPGRPPRRRSYETLLADPELEAVAIATPVSTHHPLALAALEAGKHVFVEKPLAASSAEAQDLVRAADLQRPPPHARAYVPLQPAGEHDPRPHREPASSATSTSSPRAGSTSASTSPTSASPGTSARTTSPSSATGSRRPRRT